MNYQHIEQEHPEFVRSQKIWRRYRDLYAGGEQFRERAAEYLVRRHREPADVYHERLDRVFYENYVGSIIDWYAATLMRRSPAVEFEGTDERAKEFFGSFSENCDLTHSTLTQFMKQQLIDALVCGRSYVVVDFPKTGTAPKTRAEEEAMGRSRAFLVKYGADELINWSVDALGELEWVVFRSSVTRQDSVQQFGWKTEQQWLYYDREQFQKFVKKEGGGVELVEEGPHGFAALRRVPVFEIKVSDGLWLTNKAASLQMEHFNKSNALGWALTMGLFAMPVVFTNKEWNQVLGESYYIHLGPDDKFGWTEPAGNVYQLAADNLNRLKDEIYRVSYLMMQAGDGSSGRVSGLSKQWDFSVTEEILRAYGDVVKTVMRDILQTIADARQDGLTVHVTGLNEFDISDFSADVDDAQKLLSLGIESETLRKQVFKRVALKYLSDVRQDTKTRIVEEIDAIPQ